MSGNFANRGRTWTWEKFKGKKNRQPAFFQIYGFNFDRDFIFHCYFVTFFYSAIICLFVSLFGNIFLLK